MKKSKCGEIHNSIPRKVVTKQCALWGSGLRHFFFSFSKKKKRQKTRRKKIKSSRFRYAKVAKQQRAQSTLALLEYNSTVAAVAVS
jgi:hypothetical protein